MNDTMKKTERNTLAAATYTKDGKTQTVHGEYIFVETTPSGGDLLFLQENHNGEELPFSVFEFGEEGEINKRNFDNFEDARDFYDGLIEASENPFVVEDALKKALKNSTTHLTYTIQHSANSLVLATRHDLDCEMEGYPYCVVEIDWWHGFDRKPEIMLCQGWETLEDATRVFNRMVEAYDKLKSLNVCFSIGFNNVREEYLMENEEAE